MKKLTRYEALKLLKNSVWKTEKCGQEDCWCLMIVPKKKIVYYHNDNEIEHEMYVVGAGAISKDIAKLIVKEHNEKLKKNVRN